LILQQGIKNAIYQKQISQKTTLSPLEKREVIDRILLDRASIGDAGYDTTNVVVGSMTEEKRTTAYYTIQGVEIPLSAYRDIERKGNEALLKLGINSKVTQEEVMQAYKAMTEKPKRQSTPIDQMPVYVPSSGFGIR